MTGTAGEPTDDPDFFVSYTGRDEGWAEWVALSLEAVGYRAVYQKRNFDSGNFVMQMADAVERARVIVPILSSAYLRSKYCSLEWTAFLRHDTASVIPVKIEDFEERTLLAGQVRVNVVGLDAAAALAKLRTDMTRLAGAPSRPPRGAGAPFPPVALRVAPEVPQPRLPPTPPVERLPAGRVALVVLGTLDGTGVTVAQVRALFGLSTVHDLHGSTRTAAEQRTDLAAILDGLGDDVTDVVVVAAGRGSPASDMGLSVHVRSTEPDRTATSIGLRELVELLEKQLARRRVHALVDIRTPDGTPIHPVTPAPFPVLDVLAPVDAAGPTGLAGLVATLGGTLEDLADRLGHWLPLGLHDLRDLSGGSLVAPKEWTTDVGLAPNPLAWPTAPRRGAPWPFADEAERWCFVVSAAEKEREWLPDQLDQLEYYRRDQLLAELREVDRNAVLEEQAARCHASTALSSPAAFARAVRQVCRADVAVFDVTDYEPAVMILLGIRAVIRRGVTLCVHGEHGEKWRDVTAPFHLREVSIVDSPTYQQMDGRLEAGLQQLRGPGRTYADLPAFDPVRAVPADAARRAPRPFDAGDRPTMLALVPFDETYTKKNWSRLRNNLPDAVDKLRPTVDAIQAGPRPTLLRTLDLDSPRVVSAQLYEAVRLDDFCLVDLSGARPNVLFELGVRLAANELHPIVVHDAGSGLPPGGTHTVAQLDQLRRLLAVIPYGTATADLSAFPEMVARHVALRLLLTRADHPRTATVLDGFPPSGVFDLAWRFAQAREEQVATPVADQLDTAARAVLPDSSTGQQPFAYPPQVAAAAALTGRERLVAAWLYRHFRQGAGKSDDPELAATYRELTDRLLDEFEDADDDVAEEFANQMESWLDTGGER